MRPTVIRLLSLACVTVTLLSFQNCGPAFKSSKAVSQLDAASLKSCGSNYKPGRVSVHRLTNAEYNNTVRDLVFTSKTPASAFPPSVAGASGYSNDSDALPVSDSLIEKYYETATLLAGDVIASKAVADGAYGKISPCGATVTVATRAACTTTTVRSFASRAFRRPITESGVDNEMAALSSVFNLGATFDEGLQYFLTSVLMNPKFMYVTVVNQASMSEGAQFELSDSELASRLSYFLWQSMPDDELLRAAVAGELSVPEKLTAQVKRMLKSTKSQTLTRMLRDEWLGVYRLNNSIAGLPDALRLAMITETDMLLRDIVENDKSFLQLYNSGYTYVNKALADHYGLPFTAADTNSFVKTPYNNQRLGIMSHGSFLTANSGMAAEVSIVKRGKALTNYLLCTPMPDPPPGTITNLNADPTLIGNPRQKLLQATSQSKCIGCHQYMNNLGFGLNMYSTFGQYRTTYTTYADTIDTSGSVPGILSFSDGMQMLQQVGGLSATKACFSQQLMAIATTRAVKSQDDLCVQKWIGETTSGPQAKFSDTILATVLSRQFRMQTGEAP